MQKKMKKKSDIINWILLLVGIIYILNIGFGFIEFIPDNIPGIGNIDEGIAGVLIWNSLKKLKK